MLLQEPKYVLVSISTSLKKTRYCVSEVWLTSPKSFIMCSEAALLFWWYFISKWSAKNAKNSLCIISSSLTFWHNTHYAWPRIWPFLLAHEFFHLQLFSSPSPTTIYFSHSHHKQSSPLTFSTAAYLTSRYIMCKTVNLIDLSKVWISQPFLIEDWLIQGMEKSIFFNSRLTNSVTVDAVNFTQIT